MTCLCSILVVCGMCQSKTRQKEEERENEKDGDEGEGNNKGPHENVVIGRFYASGNTEDHLLEL